MGTTKYFGQIAELGRQYEDIRKDFNTVLKEGFEHLESVLADMPHAKVDEIHMEGTREVIDRFDTHIIILKSLKNDVLRINEEVGSRGLGLFKHGKIKKKLAHTLTATQVASLKDEMKVAVNALKKVSNRNEWDPYMKYLQSHPDAPVIDSHVEPPQL